MPDFKPNTFEIACSRLYGTDTKSHIDILYTIMFHRVYGTLNLPGKSSRETIWILLAKLIVPLPRKERGEILLQFCRNLNYVEISVGWQDFY